MGSLNAVAGIRPAPLLEETFDAFRLPDGGSVAGPLDCAADSLRAAVEQTKTRCFHKDKLVIRQTDLRTGRQTLHFYAIRKGRAFWNGRDRVEPLHEAHLVSLRLDTLDGAMRWVLP